MNGLIIADNIALTVREKKRRRDTRNNPTGSLLLSTNNRPHCNPKMKSQAKAMVCALKEETAKCAVSIHPAFLEDAMAGIPDIVEEYKDTFGAPPYPPVVLAVVRTSAWRARRGAKRKRELEEKVAELEREVGRLKKAPQ